MSDNLKFKPKIMGMRFLTQVTVICGFDSRSLSEVPIIFGH